MRKPVKGVRPESLHDRAEQRVRHDSPRIPGGQDENGRSNRPAADMGSKSEGRKRLDSARRKVHARTVNVTDLGTVREICDALRNEQISIKQAQSRLARIGVKRELINLTLLSAMNTNGADIQFEEKTA